MRIRLCRRTGCARATVVALILLAGLIVPASALAAGSSIVNGITATAAGVTWLDALFG